MERPRRAALAVTEWTLLRLNRHPKYDVNTAGAVLGAVRDVQRQELEEVSVAQAAITRRTIRALVADGRVSQEVAEDVLAMLGGSEEPEPVERAETLLPIEEVIRLAKEELQQIIVHETSPAGLGFQRDIFSRMSILARAQYNLETIDTWVPEGSYLCEFLTRRRIEINNMLPEPWYSPSQHPYRAKFCRDGIHGSGDSGDKEGSLRPGYYWEDIKITPQNLLTTWDRGDQNGIVKKIALIDRTKFAHRILKEVT